MPSPFRAPIPVSTARPNGIAQSAVPWPRAGIAGDHDSTSREAKNPGLVSVWPNRAWAAGRTRAGPTEAGCADVGACRWRVQPNRNAALGRPGRGVRQPRARRLRERQDGVHRSHFLIKDHKSKSSTTHISPGRPGL